MKSINTIRSIDFSAMHIIVQVCVLRTFGFHYNLFKIKHFFSWNSILLLGVFCLLLIVTCISNGAFAQGQVMGVNIETPRPFSLCEGETNTIEFNALGPCSADFEFQIMSGSTVIQPWSTSSSINLSPITSTAYEVFLRCSDDPNLVVSDTFSIFVATLPTITGETFVCYGETAQLIATGSNGDPEWWDTPQNGNQLSSNNTLDTGPLTSDTTFYCHVISEATYPTGTVLLTECGLEAFWGVTSGDYIEVSNLYPVPVNTDGWVVAISDDYFDMNASNELVWELPSQIDACSIVSRTDAFGEPNYWGGNIWWYDSLPGWAMIVDDQDGVVDFVCWGWNSSQIAAFSTTVNGFPITLGTEWIGASCPTPCSEINGVPFSFSRTGNSDANSAADFICQESSVDALNSGLTCDWETFPVGGCLVPWTILVDLPPTATNPDTLFLECVNEVPIANPEIITDESDDYTTSPIVTFEGESTDGNSCPELITRSYRITDDCNNYLDVEHIISIHDTTTPVFQNTPSDLTVECLEDIPDNSPLIWIDNCDGTDSVLATEISDQNFCPEIITRTWTTSDYCGNTATATQQITVHDTITPQLDTAPDDLIIDQQINIPAMLSLSWSDNCDGLGTIAGFDSSDGNQCPETITRTWVYEDACQNRVSRTQTIQLSLEEDCLKEDLFYYIPNSFTPNGDEHNNTFLPVFNSGINEQAYQLIIFNRWGEVLFESYSLTNGWDGTYNGELVPSGVYIYQVSFQFENSGDRQIFTGHVNLIR